MDTLFRRRKYEEYIQKLNEARQEVGDKMNAKGITNKIDSLYDDVKTIGDKNESTSLILVLALPLFMVCLYQFYAYGFGLRFIIFGALLTFLIIYRSKIQAAAKSIGDKSTFFTDDDSPNSLISKVNYLESGIDIKQTRTSLTRNFYILFFPLLMISLGEIFSGPFTTAQYIILLLLAYLIGGGFWFKFFDEDLQELEFSKIDLSDIRAKLLG